MRIIYTMCLLVGTPVAFLVVFFLLLKFDDFMMRHFGPVPKWAWIIVAVILLADLITLAWQKAGQWVK